VVANVVDVGLVAFARMDPVFLLADLDPFALGDPEPAFPCLPFHVEVVAKECLAWAVVPLGQVDHAKDRVHVAALPFDRELGVSHLVKHVPGPDVRACLVVDLYQLAEEEDLEVFPLADPQAVPLGYLLQLLVRGVLHLRSPNGWSLVDGANIPKPLDIKKRKVRFVEKKNGGPFGTSVHQPIDPPT